MKSNVLGVMLLLMLISCGVKMESIVDENLTKRYQKPLLVIPYQQDLSGFVAKLKRKIEGTFAQSNQEVKVLGFLQAERGLALNEESKADRMISEAVAVNKNDLVIIFQPGKFEFSNGALQVAAYQLVGMDVQSKKEVWKANFKVTGTFGAGTMAKTAAEKIYLQMKKDRIIP